MTMDLLIGAGSSGGLIPAPLSSTSSSSSSTDATTQAQQQQRTDARREAAIQQSQHPAESCCCCYCPRHHPQPHHQHHSMFTSLESGRDDGELAAGGLSLKSNPLVASIMDGCETLKALVAKGRVTAELISSCRGLILMRTDKIGFGISVTQGYGVVLTRQPSMPSGWSAPLPLKVDGFSMGAVLGYSEQHTLLLLTTQAEVDAFLNDKRTMKVGLDLALGVGQKLNENKTMDHKSLNKEGRSEAANKAFTISKGYIVDVSLKGTSVEPDVDDMEAAYGEGTSPADVLQGRVKPPRQAQLLYHHLGELDRAAAATAAV